MHAPAVPLVLVSLHALQGAWGCSRRTAYRRAELLPAPARAMPQAWDLDALLPHLDAAALRHLAARFPHVAAALPAAQARRAALLAEQLAGAVATLKHNLRTGDLRAPHAPAGAISFEALAAALAAVNASPELCQALARALVFQSQSPSSVG
ncbi:MAG: hypothetical protein AMXMBFR7_25550 [Planctomycetota bacterium]